MEVQGKVKNVGIGFGEADERTLDITFSFPFAKNVAEEANQMKVKDLMLTVIFKKFRRKRSLDANAYFHVLCHKIAEALGISDARTKNILISRYGQPEMIDDEVPATLKTNIPVLQMLEQEQLHCMPCGYKTENGMEIVFYHVYRGSHTYDTKEMSLLIDGTVQEAKDIGIETMTPNQIEELKQKWGVKVG